MKWATAAPGCDRLSAAAGTALWLLLATALSFGAAAGRPGGKTIPVPPFRTVEPLPSLASVDEAAPSEGKFSFDLSGYEVSFRSGPVGSRPRYLEARYVLPPPRDPPALPRVARLLREYRERQRDRSGGRGNEESGAWIGHVELVRFESEPLAFRNLLRRHSGEPLDRFAGLPAFAGRLADSGELRLELQTGSHLLALVSSSGDEQALVRLARAFLARNGLMKDSRSDPVRRDRKRPGSALPPPATTQTVSVAVPAVIAAKSPRTVVPEGGTIQRPVIEPAGPTSTVQIPEPTPGTTSALLPETPPEFTAPPKPRPESSVVVAPPIPAETPDPVTPVTPTVTTAVSVEPPSTPPSVTPLAPSDAEPSEPVGAAASIPPDAATGSAGAISMAARLQFQAGRQYLAMERPREALLRFQEAIRLAPGFREARDKLQEIRRRFGIQETRDSLPVSPPAPEPPEHPRIQPIQPIQRIEPREMAPVLDRGGIEPQTPGIPERPAAQEVAPSLPSLTGSAPTTGTSPADGALVITRDADTPVAPVSLRTVTVGVPVSATAATTVTTRINSLAADLVNEIWPGTVTGRRLELPPDAGTISGPEAVADPSPAGWGKPVDRSRSVPLMPLVMALVFASLMFILLKRRLRI